MYIYVYIYVCMYVCIYTYMYVRTYVRVCNIKVCASSFAFVADLPKVSEYYG